jgi:hypothetical protein
VDIRYVAFQNMGRTTVQPLDSTTFDGSSVTHVGTNQIGRYPIHMHHTMGPQTQPANGYQYTLIGNAIEETTKWAITVHNSHFGLIQDNVVFKSPGSGVMTEDGSESRNVFAHNFVVGSWGSGGRQGGGREGSGYWFRGTDNYVRDNVAANILSDGPDAAYGYKYFLEHLGDVRVPKVAGADTLDNSQVNVVSSHTIPVREFARNEVYGATESGLTYWWIGSVNDAPVANMQESVFRDLRIWNVHNKAVFHYPAQKVTIDGLVMRSTDPGGSSACCQLGFDWGDYYGKSITLRNLDIQGRWAAITGSPIMDSSTFLVEDSLLQAQIGIEIQTMWNVQASAEIFKPRRYVFRNVKHILPPENRWPGMGHMNHGSILLSYSEGGTKAYTLPDEVFIYGWNQVPGDDFRVYYQQQRPDFIVPKTEYNSDGTRHTIGAPTAGMTNAQNWAQHQLAIGGAVAPCSTTRENFTGAYVCSGVLPPPPGAPRNVRIVTASQDNQDQDNQ